MQIPDKDIQQHTFEQIDSDTADELVASNAARTMLNCRPYYLGDKGVITNLKGNTLIPFTMPSGNNIGHGWTKNEATGKFYWANYNDQGFHGIYAYDILTNSVTPILQNLTDTNNIDILKFDLNFPINHFEIVDNKLAYWVDALNKARKTNINRCIDKSSTGYGTVITEDLITAYKQCQVFAPTVAYFTDLTRTSNYVYALQFKFASRFYYADGEISNTSDFSAVALPPNESYLGAQSITFDNNGINVTVETGSKDVVKIEILVKINSSDWVSCIILNKAELGIGDYSVYTYGFYNDGAYTTVDNIKVLRPYSFLPRAPYAQSFVKVAMTYSHADEGFSVVPITATVAVTFTPFYLPNGTISQLNNPLLTATLIGTPAEHGGVFNSWFTTTTHFEVGEDVKKGNIFTIICRGGNTSPTNPENFTYTATIGDSASTVSAQIKQYLRLIDAVGVGTITNETTDGSGNVSWDFTVESHESKQPIEFSTSVTAVNYSTLLDNGLSINTIKQGSSRKYGIVYEDDDGRTSLTYTTDSLLTVTPFETEIPLGQTGPIGLQQPIHIITITNQPPLWAKYWRLVRTSDTNTFIQLLIQQVNTVTVANEATYLDMVVGSLFTYQAIHPDTILKYDFERGDRLRLISNENTTPPTPYTPFFETEILSYSIDTEEFVNANITTDGTSEVLPSKAVDPNYIGKYIVINNIERLITGIAGSKYVLDQPINGDGFGTPFTTLVIPNYTFIDKRGIIRIKKPPAGYDLVSQSLIEIYRPQQNLDNTSYLNFFDFQQKYNINNWGTTTAYHVGNIQNQDATHACIVQTTNGDAYVRNRELPTNNQNPNPQVIIDQICDPNFSDFYQSNLYNTGRVYPQDQAFGTVTFGSRIRFSNNYIQDTAINGLNDFDNDDRKDYNDPYGSITLTRFRKNFLYIFKQLRTTWTPVFQNIITDNNNNPVLATTDTLLNDLQYAVWEGGIGNNGKGWFENGDYQYIPSANSGVFLRIAQDGSIPISSLYSFDKRSRELLSYVSKYNINILGGSDRVNDEALFTIPDFIEYLYNTPFNAGDWQTTINAYPTGATWAVTQQPANSTATVVGGQIQITGTSTLGNDFFKFQGTLPAGGGTTPIMNFCFTVVPNPNDATVWELDPSTLYCLQIVTNTTPFAFSFTPVTGASLSTSYTSNSQIITGINAPAVASITGGQVSINGGSFTSSPPNINNGDTVVVKQTSSASDSTTTVTSLSIGSPPTVGTYSITTIPYSNVAIVNQPFQRNNCPSGQSGTTVPVSIAAGTYTSIISQADADAQATAAAQVIANSMGTCLVNSTLATLLVDYEVDTAADLCAYVKTTGLTESGLIVTSTLESPSGPLQLNDPTAANCYVLSSDKLTGGSPAWRFGFNLAYFIAKYTGTLTSIVFEIRGRSVTGAAIGGSYGARDISEGTFVRTGSTGATTIGVSGAVSAPGTFTSNIGSGANGTVGIAVGSPWATFTYDFTTNAVSVVTY